MVKILNAFGDSYSGQAAKAGVFAHWKGRQYRRKYVIPSNPKTAMQLIVRGFFTNAVALWHTWSSLRRLAFSYLATGLVMSGYNLLVKRYQLAATQGATLPIAPPEGIKQICSVSASQEQTAINGAGVKELTNAPTKIGVLVYSPLGADTIEMDAYVDLEMGDVRIPVALATADGRKGLGNALEAGDQLCISYESGGRTVSREVLFTVPADPLEIPARAAIANAFRTAYYPIDIATVVVEIHDLNGGANEWTQLESLSILNTDYVISDSTVTPHAYIKFDLTPPGDATSKVTYTKFTAISGAKLEVTKVDTSFITWRKYSDPVGSIPIAQTIEDETYDWNLSAPGKTSVIRAAQSAVNASKHELVTMAAA